MPTLDAVGLVGASTHLATYTIRADGTPLPGTVGVLSLEVSRRVGRIPRATLVLLDGDPAKQDFEASSGELLAPGAELEIDAGYSKDESLVFRGVVTEQRIEAKRRGGSRLYIEARDAAFRMTLSRRSRYFNDVTDTDVFEEIITAHGLTPEVAATTATHEEVVQYRVSDWDFVVGRAEALGLLCLPDNGTVRVEAMDAAREPDAVLEYGRNVLDMELELSARHQPGSVAARAWDPAGQEIAEAETDDATVPGPGDISGKELAEVGASEPFGLGHPGDLTPEELDAWAGARMLRARLSRVRGTVRFQGTDAVSPGGLVELAGLGSRFIGTAFVSGVCHELGAGDWVTAVEIGLDPELHLERFPVSPLPAGGLRPAVHGVQIGVVTQLEGDPAGTDRIRVRLPVLHAEDGGTWARVATLDAGEQRGTVFRPEIGDEVVVGFLDDDANHPVVLGGLHSAAHPAPIAASDQNHEKGLVTRSGMRVVFDDDASVITIDTPNGNRVVLSDDEASITMADEAGSSVVLGTDGISLQSATDVVIKACGNVDIEGINVNLRASATLSAEGSAGAELTSSGSTIVKGSVVQIN